MILCLQARNRYEVRLVGW